MTILVTGASGFIGGEFARFALQQGLSVRINGRRAEAVAGLRVLGAEYVEGDLGDAAFVRELCQGVDAVVHCAGAVGVWGPYAHFHHGNVTVTEHVVDACLAQGVRRLLHLSSPSVYFDGRSHVGIREDQLPQRFSDHYGRTKYLAEQRVFAAQAAGLEVLAFRPRFVTGAGDTSIFPRLIDMQRRGRLAIIGEGRNQVDFTSVENLNQALFLGLQAEEQALGRVYNISDGQPQPLWDVVDYVMRRLDLPPVTRRVPYALAYAAASLGETVCRWLPGQPEPPLLRLGVAVMARSFSLDISQARLRLGYQPRDALRDSLDAFCAAWRARGDA
ncbi:NAD-dependent epimerase/dehydratase family protein [Pseudomonas mangiferae]|uniref:NAD(P)-dependent oxidoreductase n=1 Tax=Pseudomonas mangiferae TaxID=2593654 RepID=A0A553H3J8_9PSED|nr:NAD(P)-dependent oxidoreductase [Pseudomonas mangiferae]TRX76333.1 NAD(P)-dependent oxidoreductase [Pseudomonas mangiferae]